MDVNHDGPGRAGCFSFGKDNRVASFQLQQLRAHTGIAQQLPDIIGVPADVALVRGDIGNGEQPGKLIYDLLLMRLSPLTDPFRNFVCGGAGDTKK